MSICSNCVYKGKRRLNSALLYLCLLYHVLSYEQIVKRYSVPTSRLSNLYAAFKKPHKDLGMNKDKMSTHYSSVSCSQPPTSFSDRCSVSYYSFAVHPASPSSPSSQSSVSKSSTSHKEDISEQKYNGTIYSFLRSNEDEFQLWSKSLDFCELGNALNLKKANYTLFACTDKALRSKFGSDLDDIISGYLVQVNQTLISLLPQIATYHIINGTIVNIDTIQDKNIKYDIDKRRILSGTRLIPTVNGNLVIVSSNYKGEITVNNLEVAKTAVRCTNGLIYIIDSGVLTPKFSNHTDVSAAFSDRALSKGDEVSIRDSKTSAIELFQVFLRLLSRKAGSVIDGKLAGDVGFDPLGIADTKPKLKRMREIELKHARIAMLATIGWPISELYNAQLAQIFSPEKCIMLTCLTPSIPQLEGGRAPSVLTGELMSGPNAAWLGIFGFAYSALEYFVFTNRKSLGRRKNVDLDEGGGDFGFDPLNLYEIRGVSPQAKKSMRNDEIFNGRLSMLVITYYVISEFIYKEPIVDITPWAFKAWTKAPWSLDTL